MSFIKRLVNNLFGSRKEYKAEGLGTFSSKIFDYWKNDCYYWLLELQLQSYQENSTFCIKGDANSPFQIQISGLHRFMENWETMLSQIDSSIHERIQFIKGKSVFSTWKKHFYLESVWASETDNNEFEVTFTTYDLEHSFSFIWRDGYIKDLVFDNENEEEAQIMADSMQKSYRFYFFDYLYFLGELWSKSNGRMSGLFLLLFYNIFLIALPVYFLIIQIPEVWNNTDIIVCYWGFHILCLPVLLSIRYRKARKAALMNHYNNSKRIGVLKAILLILFPILLFCFELWLFGILGWVN